MRKISAKVLILILTSSFALSAQNNSERTPFRFGINASPNFAYVASSDPTANTTTQLKFGFGLITEFNFAENYSFSTGIDYYFRGGEITVAEQDYETVNDTNYSGNIKADYSSGFIQIPIMLKMRTRPFGYYTFFADFGGSLNLSTDEQAEFEPSLKSDNYLTFAGVMFSIGLGTEYDLGGSTALLAGIYYNRSLFDNLTKDAPGNRSAYSYRFDYVNLKLGVLF